MTNDETDSLGKCLKHWRLQKGQSLETIAFKTRIPLKYLRALEANDFSALPPIDTWALTLGDSLRAYREQQGVSLERISEHTRVPLVYLKALEENNTLQMPAAPVIARSFIESYLSCLTLEESQKEELMLQYAKLAEAVYAKPEAQPAGRPAHPTDQTERSWMPSGATLLDRWHEFVWTVYLRSIEWRAAWCHRTISGYRAALVWSRHLLRHAGIASVEAGHTAYQLMTLFAERICAQTRRDTTHHARWQHALDALTSGRSHVRQSLMWMYRTMLPPSDWHIAGTPDGDGIALSRTDFHIDPAPSKRGIKRWGWIVRHGCAALFLILLGSMAADIPAFTDTRLIDTKLNVSHLVEFFSYGAALVMVGLISRNFAVLLDRDRSGLAFLRPLVAPMTALVVVSAFNKILPILMDPFFAKTDRLIYDWIFVALTLLSSIWIILAWFFRSAPLLESTGAASQDVSSSRDIAASDCAYCNASMPAGMKFCGQCGASLSSTPT